MIRAVKTLHDKGIVHRDIKPDNFCLKTVGADLTDDSLKIIDFGVGKYFMIKGKHLPLETHKGIIGTARYCSLDSHLGKEAGRKDDLESIGNVLLYLLRNGNLPWMQIRGTDRLEVL